MALFTTSVGCAGNRDIVNEKNPSALKWDDKMALITDIVLATLVAAVAVTAIASQMYGFDLGPFNAISTLTPQTIQYMLYGVAGFVALDILIVLVKQSSAVSELSQALTKASATDNQAEITRLNGLLTDAQRDTQTIAGEKAALEGQIGQLRGQLAAANAAEETDEEAAAEKTDEGAATDGTDEGAATDGTDEGAATDETAEGAATQVEGLQRQITELQGQLDAAKAAKTTAEGKAAQVEALNKQIETLTAQLQAATAAKTAAEGKAALVEGLQSRITDLEGQLAAATDAETKAWAQASTAQAVARTVPGLNAQIAALTAELKAANTAKTAAEAQASTVQGLYDQIAALTALLEAATAAKTAAEGRAALVEGLQRQITELQGQLDAANTAKLAAPQDGSADVVPADKKDGKTEVALPPPAAKPVLPKFNRFNTTHFEEHVGDLIKAAVECQINGKTYNLYDISFAHLSPQQQAAVSMVIKLDVNSADENIAQLQALAHRVRDEVDKMTALPAATRGEKKLRSEAARKLTADKSSIVQLRGHLQTIADSGLNNMPQLADLFPKEAEQL